MAQRYIFTDLACEAHEAAGKTDGIERRQYDCCGFEVTDISVTDETAGQAIGRAPGRYVTIDVGRLWENGEQACTRAADAVASVLHTMIMASARPGSIMVCGLGNRGVTPDAIGPFTSDTVCVTRHIKDERGDVSDKLPDVCAISPGVVGQTGVETAEVVRGMAERVRPDVIIAVDALAARSAQRLATTVQLTDTGIRPGSGIGQRRREISEQTIGVPVIAVGVPTVTSCQTIVRDALESVGAQLDEDAVRALDAERDFFVSLNESDLVVRTLAGVLSAAIDRCAQSLCAGTDIGEDEKNGADG